MEADFADSTLMIRGLYDKTLKVFSGSFEMFNVNSTIFSFLFAALKVSVFGVIPVCIQSECGKKRTRITSNKDIFHIVFSKSIV